MSDVLIQTVGVSCPEAGDPVNIRPQISDSIGMENVLLNQGIALKSDCRRGVPRLVLILQLSLCKQGEVLLVLRLQEQGHDIARQVLQCCLQPS